MLPGFARVLHSCGKSDRMAKDCPELRKVGAQLPPQQERPQNNNAQKPWVKEKLFAFTEQEAQVSNEVIEGTLSIFDVLAKVLLDFESNYS